MLILYPTRCLFLLLFFDGGGAVSPTCFLTCTSTSADGLYVLRTVTGMCVACGKRGDVRLPPGVTAHLMDLMKTEGPNQRAVVRVCA